MTHVTFQGSDVTLACHTTAVLSILWGVLGGPDSPHHLLWYMVIISLALACKTVVTFAALVEPISVHCLFPWHGRSLADNNFNGALPSFPPAIVFFNARSNRMEGTIPAIPRSMVYLHLANNSFHGFAPSATVHHSIVFVNVDDNGLFSLPDTFDAPNALYLSIARNQLNGTVPNFGVYSPSMVYCDFSGNKLSGNINGVASGFQNWTYLALDNNTLSGSLPTVWPVNVSVLLLQNNEINGCLPGSWASNASLAILVLSNNSMVCRRGLPTSWVTSNSFPNLLALSLDGNEGIAQTPVPSSWFAKSSFNANTSLQLGGLWLVSAKSRKWRKQVCIQHHVNDMLKMHLSVKPSQPPLGEVQATLDAVLARLVMNITRNISDSELIKSQRRVDLGSTDIRLGAVASPTLDDICGNQWAVKIVVVQWAVLSALMLVLIAAYVIEVKRKDWTRMFASHVGSRPRDSNLGACAAVLSKLFALRHLVGLVFYWYDIVLDVVLLHAVLAAGASLGYGLLVVMVAHYVLLAVLVTWRCVPQDRKAWRLPASLLALLLAPLMPLLDSFTFLAVAIQQMTMGSTGWQQTKLLGVGSEQWVMLFEAREVLEVLLEAIPTAVLQSVVFVVGNRPSLGIFLDTKLYLLSSTGSCFQILRLAAVILWTAAQNPEPSKPRRSVWRVLVDQVSGKA
jgi:hypothetical protein